jgi:hypothetical protein
VLVYLVSLLAFGLGLVLLGRFVVQVRSGVLDRVLPPSGEVAWSLEPLRFLVHVVASLGMIVGLVGIGIGGIETLDPWLLVLPPGTVIAAWGVWLGLHRAGGRSGDDGEGSLTALAGRRRTALEARVAALPAGGERRMMEAALAAWTRASDDDGYRSPGDPQRADRFAALERAAVSERRRLRTAMVLAVAGLVPGPVLALNADAIVVPALALLGSALAVTTGIGAFVVVWLARRRIDDLVARARTAAGG